MLQGRFDARNSLSQVRNLAVIFPFTSFKTQFKPLTLKHTTVSNQLSIANNIFKATPPAYSILVLVKK